MKSNAFTLIELVVVIVILGILAAIAIPKYIDITEQAKLAADRSQLGSLRGSTHLLYAQNIVTNGAAPYWPSSTQTWQNLNPTNYVWKSTNFKSNIHALDYGLTNGPSYDPVNGIWAMTNGGTE